MAALPTWVPAPRGVPWSLRVRIALGGLLPLLGWIFLGVGLVFAGSFLRCAEPLLSDPFAGPLETSEGTVGKVEAAGARVNSRRVYAVHYEFTIGDRTLAGTSYATEGVPAVGAAVTVEYVRGMPAHSRIRGMRAAMFPAAVAFVLLFPAFGAILLLLGVVQGWRRVRLLRDGAVANGRLVGARPTGARINGRRVHELTFEFVAAGGQVRRGAVRSHHLDSVTDEREERLLYDPDGPRIVLWDMLPGRLDVDRDGNFLPLGLGQLGPVLIAPTLVLLLLLALAWALGAGG